MPRCLMLLRENTARIPIMLGIETHEFGEIYEKICRVIEDLTEKTDIKASLLSQKHIERS